MSNFSIFKKSHPLITNIERLFELYAKDATVDYDKAVAEIDKECEDNIKLIEEKYKKDILEGVPMSIEDKANVSKRTLKNILSKRPNAEFIERERDIATEVELLNAMVEKDNVRMAITSYALQLMKDSIND